MNNVPFFKYSLKFNTKTEQIDKFLKVYCLLNDVHLTPSETTVYKYFVLYGVTPETKNLLKESEVVSGDQHIKNMMTKFKKTGLLIKTHKKNEYIVNEYFRLSKDSNLFGIMVKFDKK